MENVVIVGAGPVGLMLAGELALTGTRPVVLDKRTEPGDLPKANGLGGQIIQFLDYRGLLGRLRAGSPFSGRPPGFPFGSVPLRFDGLDDLPLRMLLIQQPHLERLLAERATELGADLRRGRELRSLTQDEEGVTLTTASGERIRARYAIGCDGGHSLVREQAGIAFPGTTDDEVLRFGHFKAEGPANPFEDIRLDGLQPGWNHTANGRLLLTSLRHGVLIAGVRERADPPTTPVTLDDFQQAVRRVLGRDLPLGEPLWLSSTVSQGRLADRYRAGRVFLAGDAAHLFPAGGSSLNVGMMDAANLAWKLSAGLRGGAGLLDTYERERRPVAERALMQTRAQAVLDRLTGEEGAALRTLLTEVFAYEQPTRHLAGLLDGSDLPYPSSCPHPLAGRLVPDLRLTGGPRRMADLLSEGRPVILDLSGSVGDLGIDVVRAECDEPPADALLIRPDGFVAWAGTEGLAEAAEAWFGRADHSQPGLTSPVS